jgi:hypothetical protein
MKLKKQRYGKTSKGWKRDNRVKEKGKDHGSGLLIACLQAHLSLANSLEIFHSLRSLLTVSSQVILGRPLPLFTLLTHSKIPLRTPQEVSFGHVQTISTDVKSISPQLVPPRPYPGYLRFGLYPLCAHKTKVTCASKLLTCWTCCLFVSQHSAPYSITGA